MNSVFVETIKSNTKKTVPSFDINEHIEKITFNNPETIVFWKDGTKTVVKCMKGETFDKEKGLAMAIVKKINGNTINYQKIFKPAYEEKK